MIPVRLTSDLSDTVGHAARSGELAFLQRTFKVKTRSGEELRHTLVTREGENVLPQVSETDFERIRFNNAYPVGGEE